MKPYLINQKVCEAGKWAHNRRIRRTHGFQCEDCGSWISNTENRWYFTNKFGNRQEIEGPWAGHAKKDVAQ